MKRLFLSAFDLTFVGVVSAVLLVHSTAKRLRRLRTRWMRAASVRLSE